MFLFDVSLTFQVGVWLKPLRGNAIEFCYPFNSLPVKNLANICGVRTRSGVICSSRQIINSPGRFRNACFCSIQNSLDVEHTRSMHTSILQSKTTHVHVVGWILYL